ncbi:hypothetical protein [Streptomyces sp. HM190]|uniref:hypothetical protein n=1 Tax=Streptomyces sp. HM190 TaxID=2695266 RepID=UPI001358D349|nr:hypothetical protein [Streptomyces sp. HM190]
MTVLILSGVLVLVGGCVCVVRAARGGPRWVRAVATATLAVAELLRVADPLRSSSSGRSDAQGD